MSQQATPARTGIFRKKPIEASDDGPLERSIGLWQLTAIGLGAILVGVVVYATYGYRHSKLGRGEAVTSDPQSELG